jgi:hypothetical protein
MNELVKSSQYSEVVKIEIDTQIATAQMYPRDEVKCIEKVLKLCTLDEETASACFYSKPVGNGAVATGESVRFAEIVFSAWKHIRIRTYIKEETNRIVTAVCEVHDLESNIASSSEVSRSIITSKGQIFSLSQIEVTKMAAQAIAKRNAILGIVPKGLFKSTLDSIKNFSVELAKKQKETSEIAFKDAVNKTVKYFTNQKITIEQVCKLLQIDSIDSITPEQYTLLKSYANSVYEKTSTIDEIFNTEKTSNKTDFFNENKKNEQN